MIKEENQKEKKSHLLLSKYQAKILFLILRVRKKPAMIENQSLEFSLSTVVFKQFFVVVVVVVVMLP